MKKLIAGLFAALMTTAGLVAVTSTAPAQAACNAYTCIATGTTAKPAPKTIKQGKPAKVKVSVTSRGNVKVSGTVTLNVKGPGGYKDTIKVAYSGKQITLNLGKLKKPGKYIITVAFKGADGFRDSTSKSSITVKKKKK